MNGGSHALTVTERGYPLDASDAARLSRFVGECYGGQFREAQAFKYPTYWSWLYGPGARSLVIEDSERIVGHVGCIPFLARQEGRSVRGTWSVDTFVLPEYRGHGYGRHLQAAAQATSPMFASLWMSPANSRIKLSIGQEVVATMAVLRRGRFPPRQRCRVQKGPPIPSDIAKAADQHLRHWSFFIERSPAYCAWRFQDQPGAGYCQISCEHGLTLTRRCGPGRAREGMVGDAFPVDASNDVLHELLESACEHLFSEGCEAVRFGCTDAEAVAFLVERSWSVVESMRLHVPRGSELGRVFMSLSDHDIDQYPW